MTSGGQCVMTTGTTLMLLWSANSWDMHMLEVSILLCYEANLVTVYFNMLLHMYRWKGIQQCLLWDWQWTNFSGRCPV